MSDIHGRYDRYNKMLEKINFSDDDVLYILGDIIDRGPDSGRLLLDVLLKPNIELLLGNHEFMMMEASEDDEIYAMWRRNGAKPTIIQLLDMDMDGNKLIALLERCKIAIPDLEVNGKKFYLVHAEPLGRAIHSPIYLNDVSEEEAEIMLWSRRYSYDKIEPELTKLWEEYPDTTFIIGHTPVYTCEYGKYDENNMPVISGTSDGRVINIDCGCAKNVRLGCLCLETGEEFYT